MEPRLGTCENEGVRLIQAIKTNIINQPTLDQDSR